MESAYKKFNFAELEAIRHGTDTGYLMINLKKWRAEYSTKSNFLSAQELQKLVLAKQDILNIVCKNQITKLNFAYTLEPDT